jgi:two-component system sensor histidine kinase UhpB
MAAKSHAQAVAGEADQDFAGPQLSRYLFQVEEAERRRLARELHDETSQGLALVRFHLGELNQEGTPKVRKTVGDAFQVLDRTIEGLRRIVGRLSPQALEQKGLAGSIRQEARILETDHGIQVSLRISEKLGNLSPEAELALYRLVQEALHNVTKHANARNVTIDLSRKEGKVRLVIQDDGVGLAKKPGTQHHSFGIMGMRERVRCLNGTFRIRSRQGRGTRIEVYLHPSCGSAEKTPQLRLVEGKLPDVRAAV